MFISNNKEEKEIMLKEIGVSSFKDLISSIPEKFLNTDFELPDGLNEMEVYNKMKELSKKNIITKSFVGGGLYERYTPAVVKHIIKRGEFLTAYTPYQAEASQGTLQAIYEYQSLMANLYDMDYSNASMYDGSTALAEAVKACVRISNKNEILYSSFINPRHVDVIKTYFANSKDYKFIKIPHKDGQMDLDELKKMINDKTACVVVSNPNFVGVIEDIEEIAKICREKNVLSVCYADPVSLSILKTPGEAGFDFAVGEGQSLGLPLSYGGPYLGIFTCRKEHLRQMPGRICGISVDKDGKRAFVLTIQAREQHIRREKAASNICSNQALCALSVTVYLTLLGKEGLKELSLLNHNLAKYAARKFREAQVKIKFDKPFFNEFVIDIDKNPISLRRKLIKKYRIDPGLELSNLGKEFKNSLLVTFTETKNEKDIDELVNVIRDEVLVKK
jgi:glycine dehydrogenase subunit 1